MLITPSDKLINILSSSTTVNCVIGFFENVFCASTSVTENGPFPKKNFYL